MVSLDYPGKYEQRSSQGKVASKGYKSTGYIWRLVMMPSMAFGWIDYKIFIDLYKLWYFQKCS